MEANGSDASTDKSSSEENQKAGETNEKEKGANGEEEDSPLVDMVGCTANVIYIDKDIKKMYVVNAGDSRCVMAKAGKVVELSIDHSPHLDTEVSRITKAGSKI